MLKDIWAIGVDLGATKAGIAQVDSLGNIHQKISIPTGSEKKASEVIDDIGEAIIPLLEWPSQPMGIGIGIAGQMNPKEGIVIDAPNLKWHDVPIGYLLSQKLGLKVAITNDVRAAALGEWLFGSGKNCENLVCVFVGTGIGGGVVSDGKMLEGATHTFGEIGHMSIDFKGPKCACGNIGCVEAFAGGWALSQRAREAIAKSPNKGEYLLNLSQGDPRKITTKAIVEAYRHQDPLSIVLIDQATKALTTAGINLVNILNPEKLIFSGGVIIGFPEIVFPLEKGIRKYALPAAAKDVEILQGKLLNDAGIIGSAALIFNEI